MKTTKFWFIAVLGIAMTTLLFSCQKDEPFPDPDPVVISSEVIDSGFGDDITSTTGTTGTTLSYVVWIDVVREYGTPPASAPKSMAMTRSSAGSNGSTRISVTLKDSLKNVTRDVEVDFYELDDPEIAISYKLADIRELDNYVTVYDSVMVVTKTYRHFSYNYELVYQVAVYDDGVTRQVMPYHRYENVASKTADPLQDAASKVVDGFAYAVKKYRNSISVDLNEKSYDVEANLNLLRKLGPAGEPYIVKSEKTGQTIQSLVNGDGFFTTIGVNTTWSNGDVRQTSHQAAIYVHAENALGGNITVYGQPEALALNNKVIVSSNDAPRTFPGEEYVTISEFRYECQLTYNFLTVNIPLVRQEAHFDNGVLQTNFPYYEFDAEKVTIVSQTLEQIGSSDTYQFKIIVRAALGNGTVAVESTYEANLTFQ